MAWLRAYTRMLPRLQAEDTITTLNAIAIGFGGGGDDGKSYVKALQKIIGGDKPKQYASPRDTAQAMGFPVVREKG